MFLACYNMLRLFEMISRLGFIRYKSCGPFASLLAFEVKGELTKPETVKASSRPEKSWYTFPDVYGSYLHKEIRSMAQDKQNCKKYALWKWYCNLYAINGLIHCAKLQRSE